MEWRKKILKFEDCGEMVDFVNVMQAILAIFILFIGLGCWT